MAFVHIKTKQPSFIHIDGKPIGETNQENHLCLDLEAPSSFMLFSMPQTSGSPITTLINLSHCYEKNSNVKIIPFIHNHFDIYINNISQNMSLPIKELCFFSNGDKTIGVYNSGITYISAYQDGSLKTNVTLGDYDKSSIEKINNHYCILSYKNNDKFAVILDENLAPVFCDNISLLEHDNKTISLLSPFNDILGQACVTKIGEQTEKFFVYTENQTNYYPPSLTPLCLLQSIKIGNLSLSQDFLTKSLINKAESLAEYFGEIQNIFYNCYSTKKQNYTIETPDSFRSFTFSTISGKVSEITEEDF